MCSQTEDAAAARGQYPESSRPTPGPARALLARLAAHADQEGWYSYLPPALKGSRNATSSKQSPRLRDVQDRRWSEGAFGRGVIAIRGNVWTLSQQAQGCRWVQELLHAADRTECLALVSELRGHIIEGGDTLRFVETKKCLSIDVHAADDENEFSMTRRSRTEAARCPNANHVLQKSIALLPPEDIQFVVDELLAHGVRKIAMDKYGCRIVQRLLERCPPSQVEAILEAVIQDVVAFSRNSYGKFVVQKIVTNSTTEDRRRILRAISDSAADMCMEQHGCAVILVALAAAAPEDRVALAELLLESQATFMRSPCATHLSLVVTRSLEVLHSPSAQADLIPCSSET